MKVGVSCNLKRSTVTSQQVIRNYEVNEKTLQKTANSFRDAEAIN